jgi:hypothetical protein
MLSDYSFLSISSIIKMTPEKISGVIEKKYQAYPSDQL